MTLLDEMKAVVAEDPDACSYDLFQDLVTRFGLETVVDRETYDSSRWTIRYLSVFRGPGGDLVAITWDEGATEYQDSEPPHYGLTGAEETKTYRPV